MTAVGAGTTGYLNNPAAAAGSAAQPPAAADAEEKKQPAKGLRGTDKILAQMVAKNPFAGRDVPEFEVPHRPRLHPKTPMEVQVRALQRYICAFQYNHLPRTFFNCCKYRPLTRLLDTARDVVRHFLPIRCLEATILAIYLTQELKDLARVPLTFKTSFQGTVYRHIVLALKHEKAWGALGLSRKDNLMYKKMGRRGLMDLLDDYIAAYESHGHEVVNVKLGLPVSHSSTSTTVPCWRFVSVSLVGHGDEDRLLVEEIAHKFDTSCVKLGQEYEKHPATASSFVIKTKKGGAVAKGGSSGEPRRAHSLPPPLTRRKQHTADPSNGAASPGPPGGGSPGESCATSPCGDGEDGASWLGSSHKTVGEDSAFDVLDESGAGDADDNDSVDSVEENDERIKCLLAGRSPFRRNQFTAPAAPLRPAGRAPSSSNASTPLDVSGRGGGFSGDEGPAGASASRPPAAARVATNRPQQRPAGPRGAPPNS
eukprot:TRINITY_DN29876_c0_g1_i1.p1 TRINITY_DN29876_c0_g1~~TRINITY_DN29876_c0_g1_i1.p1  ORF type:complete len:482 (+),score=173.15 TRINITY_DN29876_c0_g1_i1:163-1608(+)